MMNATTLRTLVTENALTLGRLNREQLGEDYTAMNKLYTTALDALTEWASKDYAHTSTDSDKNTCFDAVKAILSLYTTNNSRIIIDETSMRTMRDCATKPKRLYSDEYKTAEKARKEAVKAVADRYDDIVTLGAPEKLADEADSDYIARVRKLSLNLKSNNIDMLALYESAVATLAVKEKKVEDVKNAGNWTWRRPVAVSLTVFADLIENYIADCLIDGYNLKPTKVIREERAAARAKA